MDVKVLEEEFFMIKVYEDSTPKYLFNNRCLIFSREGARKFSSETAALRFFKNSAFTGLKFGLEKIKLTY